MSKQISLAKIKKESFGRKVWSFVRAFVVSIATPVRFSICHGHWRSCFKMLPCDNRGEPIPWYTYPAIEFLERRDFVGRSVLEFGGGGSTSWWGARASSVTTVETDLAWYAYLRARAGSNVDLLYFDPATHSDTTLTSAIAERLSGTVYDIVVIDGRPRAHIVQFALDHVSADGAIIVDNAEGYDLLSVIQKYDVNRIDFYGFVPVVSLKHCTSLLFRNSCFLMRPEPSIPRDVGWGSGLDPFFHRIRPGGSS